jgi:hypothetical protein
VYFRVFRFASFGIGIGEVILHLRHFHLGFAHQRTDELPGKWSCYSSHPRNHAYKSFRCDGCKSPGDWSHYARDFPDSSANSFEEEVGFVLILELVTDLTSAKETTDTAENVAEQPFKLLFRGFILVLILELVAGLTSAQESANAADDVAQQALIFEFRVTVGMGFVLVLILELVTDLAAPKSPPMPLMILPNRPSYSSSGLL